MAIPLATNLKGALTRAYAATGNFPYRADLFTFVNDFLFTTDATRLTLLKTAGQTSPTGVNVVPTGTMTVTMSSEANGEQTIQDQAQTFQVEPGYHAQHLFEVKYSQTTNFQKVVGLHTIESAGFLGAPEDGIILHKAQSSGTWNLQAWVAGVKEFEAATDITVGTNPTVIAMEIYCASATSIYVKLFVNGFPVTITGHGEAANITSGDIPTGVLAATVGVRTPTAQTGTFILGKIAMQATRAYSGGVAGYGDSSGTNGGAGGQTGSGGGLGGIPAAE